MTPRIIMSCRITLRLRWGRTAIRFGGRLRAVRDANSSTAGFNGNYTYASLDSYAAGQPSQYEVTVGTPAARVMLFDAGAFLPG